MRFHRIQLPSTGEILFAREDSSDARLLLPLAQPPWLGVQLLDRPKLDPTKVRFLSPVSPSKIVCIGRNYSEHAKELGHEVPTSPHVFMKPISAILDPGGTIVRPTHMSSLVHHEGELVVVIGKKLKSVSAADALAGVFGYTAGNDVTARDLQREDKHFTRAKGFDTFCPIGPVLVSADEIGDPQALSIEVRVGDQVRQRGSTADMVFSVAQILSYISEIMSLVPGDAVFTGTPAGVGPLQAGDEVSVAIAKIGELVNRVVDRPKSVAR